jgi:UDP-N-acetyl-D-mannosaminuronate dehydrogenase
LEDALRDADLVFFAMNHDEYLNQTPDALRKKAKPDAVVCDIRNKQGTGEIVF